jgi:hypothetical protein
MEYTGESLWEDKPGKAYRCFLNTFWLKDGCPKYYHNALYTIDIHALRKAL